MTNTALLEECIRESGLKISAIAKKCGFSRQTLNNKVQNRSEFTASEIAKMSDVLSLTRNKRDCIFFAQAVELNATQRRKHERITSI